MDGYREEKWCDLNGAPHQANEQTNISPEHL
jgi:hypothetical protein